jgi:hypothetical protein
MRVHFKIVNFLVGRYVDSSYFWQTYKFLTGPSDADPSAGTKLGILQSTTSVWFGFQ